MAGQRKFPKDHDVEEEEDDDYEINEPSALLKQQPVQLHPFGRLIPELNAVVIEPSVNREHISNFKTRNNYLSRPQAFGALAGQDGLGLYKGQSFIPQTSVVRSAVQLHNGLMYPYPLKVNYNLNYPNYVQSRPQYQVMTYSPWFMGKWVIHYHSFLWKYIFMKNPILSVYVYN